MRINANSIICKRCGNHNPSGSNFCNNCASALEKPAEVNRSYGVFFPGGYGDGYMLFHEFCETEKEALEELNAGAKNSIYEERNIPGFLGLVDLMNLLPEDKDTLVSYRVKVVRWWKVEWDGISWTNKGELSEHPASLGLSHFE